MKNQFYLALKGAAMGIAESIPGVSGGTIAFITGIYERMLESIKAFSPELIGIYRNDGFRGVWKAINGNFLAILLAGMAIGLGIGIIAITYLIEYYPPILWAFFFGLIIASVWHIGKQIRNWDWAKVSLLVIGAIVAYSITKMPVGVGSESLLYIFFAGTIAISALLLPGVSGSFILLLMGVYQYIFHDVIKEQLIEMRDLSAFIPIGALSLGCLVGLLSFARILSWTFKRYHDQTLAILTGFMIGSLNKLWPWRVPTIGLDEHDNVVNFAPGMELDKVIKEINVFPEKYTSMLSEPAFVPAVIIAVVGGFFLVLLLERFDTEAG